MTQPKTNRIPAPLYAAAGAGDLAIEQLRKLPTVVTDLGGKVVAGLGGKAVVTGFELRQRAAETLRTANQTATELSGKGVQAELNRLREAADVNRLREAADLDRIRELATRNAAVVVAGAQAAQVRALAAYGELVARGERVVGAGVLDAADAVNADIEATEAELTATPAVTEAPVAAKTDVPTPADVAEVVEAKPAAAKTPRTRATKATAAKATGKTAPTATTDTPSAKLPKTARRTGPAAE
ncbi:hypothetical protein [Micromonospora sp. CA-111912]|uniref:hypothetical protein n=1 Tax=Micromonospora sp. CA-111912 TaxID=3239955 RepID=UPI003D8C5888